MEKYLDLARDIFTSRYPTAEFVIAAGSIIRGEGTTTSDLDLVVLYSSLKSAYRESFTSDGIMVEAFVHDPSTLRYFIQTVDYGASMPVMANMINEGIVIPGEIPLSKQLKRQAADHLALGPAPATQDALCSMRYSVTNLIDDLKDSRNRFEQIGTACRLYEELAMLYFASNRLWRGTAKSIPRAMSRYDGHFSDRFHMSFDHLQRTGDCSRVISVAEEILQPIGGYLFEGYRLEASEDWRTQ